MLLGDEGVLQWFPHVERMENERIAKRVYVGEFAVVSQWVSCRRGGLIL